MPTEEDKQVIDRMERITVAIEAVAERLGSIDESINYVAIGVAKIVERCFCGDLLEQHPDSGKCENAECEAQCEKFLPIHLALTRIHNSLAIQVKQLNERLAPLLPSGDDAAGAIVHPFNPFKTN